MSVKELYPVGSQFRAKGSKSGKRYTTHSVRYSRICGWVVHYHNDAGFVMAAYPDEIEPVQ